MEDIDRRDARLRRMKWWATGLLVLAGAIYVAAQMYEARYPWLYYVSVTAEASGPRKIPSLVLSNRSLLSMVMSV